MCSAIQTKLSEIESIAALQPIIEQAEVKLSLSGERYLDFSGFGESLPIDALAARVIELVNSNFEFSEEERLIGKKIATQINDFYRTSDDLINASRVVTRLLAKLRDFWCDNLSDNGYGTRWQWRYNRGNELFDYYTKTQYEKVFKQPITGLRYRRSQTNCPDRWRV